MFLMVNKGNLEAAKNSVAFYQGSKAASQFSERAAFLSSDNCSEPMNFNTGVRALLCRDFFTGFGVVQVTHQFGGTIILLAYSTLVLNGTVSQ